jgi:hypothetical protein
MNEHQQNWVTVADLGRVITDIVDNPLPQMIYAWDALSDDEKLALSLLGEVLADGSPYATAAAAASVQANDYPVNLWRIPSGSPWKKCFAESCSRRTPRMDFASRLICFGCGFAGRIRSGKW